MLHAKRLRTSERIAGLVFVLRARDGEACARRSAEFCGRRRVLQERRIRARYFAHMPPPAGSLDYRTQRFAVQRLPRSRCAERSDFAPRRRTAGLVTARRLGGGLTRDVLQICTLSASVSERLSFLFFSATFDRDFPRCGQGDSPMFPVVILRHEFVAF